VLGGGPLVPVIQSLLPAAGTVRTRRWALASGPTSAAICGLTIDRDLNAAINLAIWAGEVLRPGPGPPAGGPVTNAPIDRLRLAPTTVR
jgi:hypothetical protein